MEIEYAILNFPTIFHIYIYFLTNNQYSEKLADNFNIYIYEI